MDKDRQSHSISAKLSAPQNKTTFFHSRVASGSLSSLRRNRERLMDTTMKQGRLSPDIAAANDCFQRPSQSYNNSARLVYNFSHGERQEVTFLALEVFLLFPPHHRRTYYRATSTNFIP
jgi:hypothetical protein